MQLNPQQQAAVDAPHDQSILVIAGAGSGKTTVIALRAINVARALPVGKHLQMLTFSNKAAKEMKERVTHAGNRSDLDLIRFDTFHSFGIKLLKDDPEGYGLKEGFSLLNESDVKRSLRQLAKAHGLPDGKSLAAEDRKRLNPVNWHGTWSLARQAGYDVRNANNAPKLRELVKDAHGLSADELEVAWKTLSGYEHQKQQGNAVDFDDLLYLPLLRVARDADYRTKVQSSIGYVVVDESQDTNRIQYELIKHLALGHVGVTCVGDDDQSIYGWRGAEVTNLRRFVANFGAVEMRLEQNYRSTKAIVNAAGALIQNNESRLIKSPFSMGDAGDLPVLHEDSNSFDMADRIASKIAGDISRGESPSQYAVLYRTNRMAMLIEQSLRRFKVPYHVVGGMSLFDRSEVVAVTSAMRLASNPADIFALKSLQPYVDQFGAASCYGVCDWLENEFDVDLTMLPESIPSVTPKALKALRVFVEDLRAEALMCDSAEDFVRWVIDGPMAVLEREKDDVIRERKAQYLEVLASDIDAEQAERKSTEPAISWRDVMLEVALRDARQSEAAAGQVTLSTVHRSKGLEWPFVFVAGFSEGLMPLDARTELADDDAACGHIEEERRLGYVAITRAKKQCWLLHADHYAFPGGNSDKVFEPSRFVTEIGDCLSVGRANAAVTHDNDQDDELSDVGFFKNSIKGMFAKGLS